MEIVDGDIKPVQLAPTQMLKPLPALSSASRLLVRAAIEQDQLAYSRYTFRSQEEINLIVRWHHKAICRAFDMVLALMVTRLIINLPPGFTKTMFLIHFLSRLYGLDAMSRNIHASYSASLARENSDILIKTLQSPDYKLMFPVRIREDKSGVGRWKTEQGGGLLAAGMKGGIIGFRAGRIVFGRVTGIAAIDDPIKPEDANSKPVRDRVNATLVSTVRSRLALPTTPIIMTMQRLHDNDPTGFCLRGGTGDEWHHLNLPAKMQRRHLKPGREYARKNPYGKPLIFPDLFQKGWTWPDKIDKKEYKILGRNPFVRAAQIDQEPRLVEGNFIKGKWIRFYTELPEPTRFRKIIMIVDTALEAGKENDRTVWQVWGQATNGVAYLLDYWGARMEVPEIEPALLHQWLRWRKGARGLPRMGVMKVEKKASGHGVIQGLSRKGVHVVAMERSRDKVARAYEAVPAFINGAIALPHKNYRGEYTDNSQFEIMMEEILQFSADNSHANDDYCDCIFDAADEFYNGQADIRSAFG